MDVKGGEANLIGIILPDLELESVTAGCGAVRAAGDIQGVTVGVTGLERRE